MRLSQYNSFFQIGEDTVVFNSLSQKYRIFRKAKINSVQRDLVDYRKRIAKSGIDSLTNIGALTLMSQSEEQAVCDAIYYHGTSKGVLRLTLVTTMECNFDCIYCAQKHQNVFMNEKVYERVYQLILRNVRNFNVLKIVLFGGEPTLAFNCYEKFLQKVNDLIKYYKKHMIGVMISNGYLLSETMLRKLYKLGITQFQITLDASPAFHDKMRILKNGQKTFEVIYNNLLHICSLKELYRVSVVLLINTTYEMLQVTESWEPFFRVFRDDSRFSINVSVVEDRGGSRISLLTDSLVTETNPLYAKAVEHFSNYLFWNDTIQANAFVCESLGKMSYTIDWNGNIRACSQLTRDNVIGEIREGGRVHLTNPNILFSVKNNKSCRGCSIEPLCHGKSCGYQLDCHKEELMQLIRLQLKRNIEFNSLSSENYYIDCVE